jgi:hypothetical protein
LSVPRIATLATAAVTRVNHVLETASSPDFFSSLLSTNMNKGSIDSLYGSFEEFEKSVIDEAAKRIDLNLFQQQDLEAKDLDLRRRFTLWVICLFSLLFFEKLRSDLGEW